jgi:thioredoxin 1
MANLKEINNENFDKEVLNSTIPVIADFWAPWCGPCQRLAPILEEVAKKYSTQIKFVKINTDENPELASKFSITGIPTLIFFKDGKEVKRSVGVISQKDLEGKIKESFF